MPALRRTRRIGSAAAAAAALLAAVATTTTPAHAASPAYPVLAGVNTVTTSTSGVVTVQMTQAATVDTKGEGIIISSDGSPPSDQSSGPTTGITGDGRLISMVLEQNGVTVFDDFWTRGCPTAGCSTDDFGGWPEPRTKRGRLQPGLYHLYVTTDGAPVTATLVLKGLSGTSNLSVAPIGGATITPYAQLVPSTGVADPPAYSGAASGTIGPHGGFLLGIFDVTTASFEGDYARSCVAPGTPPAAWAPGCDSSPDQNTLFALISPNTCVPALSCDPMATPYYATTPTSGWGDFDHRPVGPGAAGTWSQGGYLYGVAVPTEENGEGLWLSYVDMPASGATQGVTSAPPSTPPSPTATPTPTPTTPSVSLPNTGRPASADVGAGVLAFLVVTLLGTAVRRGRAGRPGQERRTK